MLLVFLVCVVTFSLTFAGVDRGLSCIDGDVKQLDAGNFLLCVAGTWKRRTCLENDCLPKNVHLERVRRDVEPADLLLLELLLLLLLDLIKNGTTTTRTPITLQAPPPRKQKPGSSVFPSECGFVKPEFAFGISNKVSGGEEARIDQSPWQIAIMNRNGRRLSCGGSVISESYVLTAAHCFIKVEIKEGVREQVQVKIEQRYIFAGATNLKERAREFNISRVVLHPEYSTKTKDNDIALLEISEKFTFTATIQPICIPYPALYQVNRKALITGWGAERSSADTVDKLKRGVVYIIAKSECSKRNGQATNITDGMFCAGDIDDDEDESTQHRVRTDTCQGDSGGPLFTTEGARNYLLGITSWGIECGLRAHPGVYTKVINYQDWIKKTITG